MAALILTVQVTANLLMGPHARVLGYASNITAADLLTLTNQQRAANGLPALRLDARLNQSATLKANNMFAEDYWAHVSPSGIQPWYWFQQAGYHYTYAGENLAKDFDTSDGVMQGWMNSPGHRANILNANYKDVGFSVENGTLVGGQTTLVVAHYGAEASTPAATAAPTPKPTVKPAAVVATATPAASPAPTPTPSPVASPAASSSPAPSPSLAATLAPAAPVGVNRSLFQPVALLKSLNWGEVVTIFLLLLLLGVFVATHWTAWRKRLKHWDSRRYRYLAAVEVLAVLALMLIIAASGVGKIG
ncbi:MAG TPA: CAP domain-containing protein, partial [Candidatus Saccharimonadia bacterium]